MSDGVKLASGYIELTVKSGDAMKDITAEITGVGKAAEKAGKQAGDALNKGLSKGAKDAGKSVGDELAKATEKAADDAGAAISKGIEKGAKDAGKAVSDEIGKATKKAADDVVKTKIEPKVTPKVDTKQAESDVKGLGKSISDSLRDAAEKAGYSMDQVWAEAGKRAGSVIGGALADTPIGGFFRDLQGDIAPVIDGVNNFRDALTNAGKVSTLGPVSSTLKDIGTTLGGFTGGSKLETALAGIGGKAAQLASVAGALEQVVNLVGDPRVEKVLNGDWKSGLSLLGTNVGTDAAIGAQFGGIPGALIGGGVGAVTTGGEVIAGAISDHEKFKASQPKLPPAPTTQQQEQGIRDAFAIPAPGGGQSSGGNPLKDLLLPGHARGTAGVDSSGRLFGPGTGTSDSIIGLDGNGIPTAKVSTGEGVVKKSAMDRGGAAVVAGLNNGDLPGYDDGTNNVGGPPIPPPQPQIQVQPANTGQAGQFNSWLSQQQGKQYQYGTLYDCSGFMSQVYNQMTGKQMPRFNTESDLSAYGFMRGSQPGTFQLGIHHGGGGPNAHMAGTLPDGRNVESAGNGVQVGAGAHGASDKQFEDHWFLPGSAGAGAGGAAGTPVDPASAAAAGGPAGIGDRTQGYIPAGAGAAGQSGSSLFSGALGLGAQAINGWIDQAGSAAATAIGAAATAGSFGAGGEAAGPAASFAIGIGTKAAERGVSYGFQMAGIAADALTEIFSPFGVPRYFQTDPTQFMPHLGVQPTAVTTGEKAKTQGEQQAAGETPNPALNPGGPVQAGQLPGAQPIAPPVQAAKPSGVAAAPVPIGAPPGAGPNPAGPAVPKPVSPIAPPTPQSGPQADPSQQQPPKTGIGPFDSFLSGLSGGGVVGVYDDGGWLPAGGVAINQSKRPEPILNDQQWAALNAAVAAPASPPDPSANGGHDYSVTMNNVTTTDADALADKISAKQRLQMMRYAGRP